MSQTLATPAPLRKRAALSAWLQSHRDDCTMCVEPMRRSESREWLLDRTALRHRSGGFFSVVGGAVLRHGARDPRLDQPLIDQPEIGILGFLVRTRGGCTELLVQAKPEPGNVGIVQAAPTVQATLSNYTRRHHGAATRFLEHFAGPGAPRPLSDSLQSEQGTRFRCKYNRNVTVRVSCEAPLPAQPRPHLLPRFKWVAVEDFCGRLIEDCQVNTDARSVLASSDWTMLAPLGRPFERWRGAGGLGEDLLRSSQADDSSCAMSISQIEHALHASRARASWSAPVIPLHDLEGWKITDWSLHCAGGGAFELRHYRIESAQREVSHWDQPLVVCDRQGEIALLAQRKNGILHLLFRCRPEIGFRELIQFGPTIQDGDRDADALQSQQAHESTQALAAALDRSQTLLECLHSDEGGRFFRCVSRYRICLVDDSERLNPGANNVWMTVGQIRRLIQQPGMFTNEARSLVSMLLAYL